ncbi:MAG: hypothetical protein GY820_01285 [Gammaproteobacteria bacterium]|nr:hypothetical protein [Gammaproteobacteria bacterium]
MEFGVHSAKFTPPAPLGTSTGKRGATVGGVGGGRKRMPARNARLKKAYVQVEEEEGENEEEGEGEEDEEAAGVEVDQEETAVVEGDEQPTPPRPLVDEPSTSTGGRYAKEQRKRVRACTGCCSTILCIMYVCCWLQAVFRYNFCKSL